MNIMASDLKKQRPIPQALTWSGLLTKRLLDLAVSAGCLILLSPVLAAISGGIKLDSPGPIVFRQTRVGKDGRNFTFYKFRTMVSDAEQKKEGLLGLNEASGPMFKIRHDPRTTRLGSFLRKYSLDELPQFFNVLKGDMSLVGPRPPLRTEVNAYGPVEMKRLLVTPGLTGLWQVSGRSDVSFENMIRLDLQYMQNWSLLMDLRILLRTIPAVISGKGAY
jgi:exopolysaccharide biosynthesis polyprenyl glycosylphosphotransferase